MDSQLNFGKFLKNKRISYKQQEDIQQKNKQQEIIEKLDRIEKNFKAVKNYQGDQIVKNIDKYRKASLNYYDAQAAKLKLEKAIYLIKEMNKSTLFKAKKMDHYNNLFMNRIANIQEGGGFFKGIKNLFGRERNQQINAFLTCFLNGNNNMQYEYTKLPNSSKLIIARFFKLYEPERMNDCLRSRKNELINNGNNRYYKWKQNNNNYYDNE